MVLGHEWETGGTETSDSGGENGGGGREEPTAGNRRVRQTKGLNGNPRITINAIRSKPEGILKKIGSPKQGYNEKRKIETKRYNGKKSDRNT